VLITILPAKDPSRKRCSLRIIGAWRILERGDNCVDYNTAQKIPAERDTN
jgi:hypothetical protein